MRGGAPADLLTDFADLVSWFVQAGRIDEGEGRALVRRWLRRKEGGTAFSRAIQVRAVLTRSVECMVKGGTIPDGMVACINKLLRRRSGYPQLVRDGSRLVKHTRIRVDDPADLISPVEESAADFVCSADLALLRKCANPACVLYFYDTTKNHARRWCSMSACGNRTKVVSYYRRMRAR